MAPAISVENLSKSYCLGLRKEQGYRTLRETIMEACAAGLSTLRRLARIGARPAPKARPGSMDALNDVSFQVQRGEVLGVIGRNGAGKSTLLKILSKITDPTSGRVLLRGRVGSLLEVGTGFHPELSGRENIFLNGAILGMTRHEIRTRFDEIVEFAEIARFIDTPVKRYSSGMYVRLAFSVAAHLCPDILLIDEVLAVGDLAFQRKCMEHARRMREQNSTLLVVSHNMFTIKAMCDRAIYLSQGRVCFDGAPGDAIQLYEKDNRLGPLSWAQARIGPDPSKYSIHVKSLELLNEVGQPRTVFDYGERMRICLRFEASEPVPKPNFVICFQRSDNVSCCNYNSLLDELRLPLVCGKGEVEVLTPPLKLVSELYAIHILVWDEQFKHLYCGQVGTTFHVRHQVLSTHFGVFHEPAEWRYRAGWAGGTDR